MREGTITMIEPNNKIYLARKGLIDECMKEIISCKEWERLKIRVYYEVGKLGERIQADKEGLFDARLWSRKENRGKIIELVKAFLWRQIK